VVICLFSKRSEERFWGVPAEDLAGPSVEFRSDFGDPFGAMNVEVGSFREVVPQEPIGSAQSLVDTVTCPTVWLPAMV